LKSTSNRITLKETIVAMDKLTAFIHGGYSLNVISLSTDR